MWTCQRVCSNKKQTNFWKTFDFSVFFLMKSIRHGEPVEKSGVPLLHSSAGTTDSDTQIVLVQPSSLGLCYQCGTMNSSGVKSCVRCGWDVRREQYSTTPSRVISMGRDAENCAMCDGCEATSKCYKCDKPLCLQCVLSSAPINTHDVRVFCGPCATAKKNQKRIGKVICLLIMLVIIVVPVTVA